MTYRNPLCAVALVAISLLAAGCGGAAETKDAESSTVLRIPYLADMSVPDPDVFYDIEGNSVILSTYDGLLKYAPSSTEIVGALATDWEVSPDRLTYTFELRDGVKFHSGAPLTSSAVKDSFQRRIDVGQAPSYMLRQVAEMRTPDPLTFVVELKRPVNPFLAYMASSWGPKIIGPGAIKDHAGSDFAQEWLSTHEDGTGAFELTGFERGRQYTLTRSPDYWGEKPFFSEVLLKIVPDIGSQRLQVQNGDLDAVLHSFPASELESLPSSVRVVKQDALLRLLLYVNTNKAPFDDPAVRAGLSSTFDLDQLVEQAYSDTATKSTGAFPPGLLPGEPPLPYDADADAARAAAAKAKTKEITLAYSADESGVLRRVGELLQAQLVSLGYEVTLSEVQLPQVYGYIEALDKAPDLLLGTNTPDAADPDTWARIVFYSTGGLNFLGFKDEAVDRELDEALSASDSEADALYKSVADRVIDSDSIFFLGDVKNVFVLGEDLDNVENVPAYPWTIDFRTLTRTGG